MKYLKLTIMATQVKRMNERMQQELDKLWESGELSNEKLQEMQSDQLTLSLVPNCF